MRAKSRQTGMTLTELTVVIAAIAVLAVLTVPAVRALLHSFESGSSTRAMIGAALASARAMAAREQSYVGVRFQMAYDPDGPLKAPQYMIFVMHDKQATKLAYGFRAMEGLKPVKLPDSVGVMDWSMIEAAQAAAEPGVWEPGSLEEVTDLTAFSIVFSPAGKLVIHDVRVAPASAGDDVFNTLSTLTDPVNPAGMFVEDNDVVAGLEQEASRNSFIIYDRGRFERAYKKGQGYSGYLAELGPIYVNPYMGTLISTE